ncbi:MAG: alpha-amylase family glycosyl hydrolase, partial [Ignavibacteriaceae bacterium]
MFAHNLASTDSGAGINGSMNNWTNGIFKMEQNQPGLWETILELLPQTYEYKFVTYTDTVGQAGVTGYYTDPLNSNFGGPFNNSFFTVRDPMIYYLLPKNESNVSNVRPTISAQIAVSNSSTLDESKISFTLDGQEINNASSYYNSSTKTFSYTPSQNLSYANHTAYLKVFNTKGDFTEDTTTFKVVSAISIAPYTFNFDSRSPNFNFLGDVMRVDIKGDFNSQGLNQMTDDDSDGVYSYKTNLNIYEPNEYTIIVNSGLYMNDPDNPLLSTNHRTMFIKTLNPKPEYIDFLPSENKIYIYPQAQVSTFSTVVRSDSNYSLSFSSIKATYDGANTPIKLSSFGTGYKVTVNIDNPAIGRHVIEFLGSDAKSNIVWPAKYAFGVYTSGTGYNYVDGESDDNGDGNYIYPSSVPEGSADIQEINISSNASYDSLIFSIRLKKISDFSRIGFSIVNDINGNYVDAMDNVELKIPEWNLKGVYAIVTPPTSTFFDSNTENKLYVSREPLQSDFNISVDTLTGGIIKFSLPLSLLETVMGNFNKPWYFGAYTYLKDQNGTIEVSENEGGKSYVEDTDVYDAAFFFNAKTQKRLLGNYSSQSEIGGPRVAAIGNDERGYIKLSPADIDSMIMAAPVVKLYANGGDLFNDSVKIAGFADVNISDTVTIMINNLEYKAVVNSNKEFEVNAVLNEGINKIYAQTNFNGNRISKSAQIEYNYIIDHNPVVKIETTANQNSVTMDASSSFSPDSSPLTFNWAADIQNPVSVSLNGGTTSTASFTAPAVKGEYYFTVTATDINLLKKSARTVVVVTDSGAVFPDYSYWHPSWMDSSIIYSIFVRTFSDAGTFNNVTQRMQSIKDLGVDCIWFLPIHPTTNNLGPDNPGYATTNYLDVLESYGTKNDFKTLVETAHQFGIKVILDHVIQHTSVLHPFMKDANQFKANSPYYPFYMWDQNNNFQYLFTWVDLPSINYENESTRDYLLNAAKYWMNDFDIDGYRCDVAWAINDLRVSGPAYWQKWRSTLKSIKPDAIFIAEADAQFERYFDKKFDMGYDWNWFSNLRNLVSNTGSINALDSAVTYFFNPQFPKDARPFRFLENHDEQRFIDAFGIADTKLAAAILFTSPGVPMLYAGQEVGEETFRGNINWNDPHNLLPYYKNLIKIRKQNHALTFGNYQRINNTSSVNVYSYLRVNGDNNVIVNVNFSSNEQVVNISVPLDKITFDSTSSFYLNDELNIKTYGIVGTDLKNFQVTLPPNGAQILVLSNTPLTEVKDETQNIPLSYKIEQNYPNPFNPSTTIKYSLPFGSHVKINIYNILGQQVSELVNQVQNAGNYETV